MEFFFSKIDLSDAYLQILVEEVSSKQLCINKHRGLYKFESLLFRVKVTPAIFQQKMDTMLSGLDFAVAYTDDIRMKRKSKHKEHVHKVFTKIQDYGFLLKETKCNFFMEKNKYPGHIIDKDGRRPDPERAAAINQTGDISTLDGTPLKLVDKFTYLVSSVASIEKDIDTKLTKAWTPINRLSIIWKSDLTDKMKCSFF